MNHEPSLDVTKMESGRPSAEPSGYSGTKNSSKYTIIAIIVHAIALVMTAVAAGFLFLGWGGFGLPTKVLYTLYGLVDWIVKAPPIIALVLSILAWWKGEGKLALLALAVLNVNYLILYFALGTGLFCAPR